MKIISRYVSIEALKARWRSGLTLRFAKPSFVGSNPTRASTMKDKLYFVGLKAFIVNEKHELLILQGSNKMKPEGLWGLPGGRIMEGEEQTELSTILAREIREECGLIQVDIGEITTPWRFFTKDKAIFLLGYTCTYKGGEVHLSEEHSSYKWVTEKDIEAIPFIDGYKEVIVSFFSRRNSK